jgi:tetratricopeptide (TPR) repeat protein
MSRARKQRGSSSKKTGSDRKPEAINSAEAIQHGPVRSTLRDVLIGLLVCVVFFAVVEGVLRILGVPARNPGEDPFVGFSNIKPLYEVKNGIASAAAPKLRLFNPASFSVEKPENTTRIFCFGGSTTYGHPFDGRTAFPRWLQELLSASSPERKFEVLNAGGISYASYRIVPLVKECLGFQPDLMVFYMGHNEFLERRTYRGLFEQGHALVTVRSVLEESNTYQALRWLLLPRLRSLGIGREPAEKHEQATNAKRQKANISGPTGPPKPVLEEEVTAILDRSGGLDLYHRDEEFSRGVVAHFGHNLRTIMRLCRNQGVPVIVVDPPSNLKDFSPFKSEHGTNLTASEKSHLETQLQTAIQLVRKQQGVEALKILDECIGKDPAYAEYYFWKGKALLGLGRNREAKENFVKAKDIDVCPLRCVSEINRQILNIAPAEQAILIPFREILDRRVSEGEDHSGVPGNESFLDHVHPTVALHQYVAELILDKMVENSLMKPSVTLTSDDRAKVYRQGMEALDKRFFMGRDLNLAKTLRWAGKKQEARAALENIAASLDDNAEVHQMLGGFLLQDGEREKALEEYRKAVQLSGEDPPMVFSLAVVCRSLGLKEEAVEWYRKLIDKDKSVPDAFANLATMRLEEGKVNEALNLLKKGLNAHPDSSVLFGPYGLALAMTGKESEGIPWMLRAIEAEPGDPKLLYNLAGMYSLQGKSSEALNYLDLAVQRGYSNPDMATRDPVFAAIREDPAFKRTVDKMR